MKKMTLVLVAMLVVFPTFSFAQATPPAPTAAPAAPAYTVKSVSPTNLVSDDAGAVTKKIVVRGSGLKAVTKVAIADAMAVMLEASAFTSDDTVLEAMFLVPAKASGTYKLYLNDAEVGNVIVTVKNAADVEREKAEADHKRLVAQARAGAEAAKKVATQQKLIDELTARLNTQQAAIADLKARPTIGVTEVRAMVASETKGIQETLKMHGDLITATATATQNAQQAVAQLQQDTGLLAENMPKRGSFLGLGGKKPAQVAAIADRYRSAIDAANAAAAEGVEKQK